MSIQCENISDIVGEVEPFDYDYYYENEGSNYLFEDELINEVDHVSIRAQEYGV